MKIIELASFYDDTVKLSFLNDYIHKAIEEAIETVRVRVINLGIVDSCRDTQSLRVIETLLKLSKSHPLDLRCRDKKSLRVIETLAERAHSILW